MGSTTGSIAYSRQLSEASFSSALSRQSSISSSSSALEAQPSSQPSSSHDSYNANEANSTPSSSENPSNPSLLMPSSSIERLVTSNRMPPTKVEIEVPIKDETGQEKIIKYKITIHHKANQQNIAHLDEEVQLIKESIKSILVKLSKEPSKTPGEGGKCIPGQYINSMCLFYNEKKGIVGTISLKNKAGNNNETKQILFHEEFKDEAILENLRNLLDMGSKSFIRIEQEQAF